MSIDRGKQLQKACILVQTFIAAITLLFLPSEM